MVKPIIMPQIGQDITTGRVIAWLAKEGQPVKKGDVVAQVESDKAVFEVEALETGVLLKILVPEGEEGRVFDPICIIGEPRELEADIQKSDAPAVMSTSSV